MEQKWSQYLESKDTKTAREPLDGIEQELNKMQMQSTKRGLVKQRELTNQLFNWTKAQKNAAANQTDSAILNSSLLIENIYFRKVEESRCIAAKSMQPCCNLGKPISSSIVLRRFM
jgi:hypothetical protein